LARKRFARETVRSECLQHGHPCSEVGFVARATVRRRRLHIRISALRPRSWFGQPGCDRGLIARATCAMGRASTLRATAAAALASEHRRPVQLGLLHRSGNWAAQWLCCSGAPCSVAASLFGKPGGEAARVREPRAVRLLPEFRATGMTARLHGAGDPCMRSIHSVWETGAGELAS